MNRSILFPLYFLLMFLIFIFGGLGLSALIFIVSYPEAPSIPGLLMVHMGSVFPGVLIGAFLVTWVWAWSQIRKYIQKTALVTMILIVLSTLAIGMFSFLGALWYPQQPTSLGHGISSRFLHGNSQLLIRSHSSGPVILNQVYVRQLYPQQPGRFLPRVVFDGSSQELLIPGFIEDLEHDEEIEFTGLSRILDELRGLVSPLSVTSIETTLRGAISLHPLLQQLVSGIQSLGLVLIRYGADISYRLFFMAGAFSIFCAGAGLFQKGTGWPFWGTFMGLAVTATGVVVVDFFFSPDIQDLASSFLQPRAMAYLGPGILAATGLLFGFVSLITSPLPKSFQSGGGNRIRSKERKERPNKEKKKKAPKPLKEKKSRTFLQPKKQKESKPKKAPKAKDEQPELTGGFANTPLVAETRTEATREPQEQLLPGLNQMDSPKGSFDEPDETTDFDSFADLGSDGDGPDGFDELEFHDSDESVSDLAFEQTDEIDQADAFGFDDFAAPVDENTESDGAMDDDTFSFDDDFGNLDQSSTGDVDDLGDDLDDFDGIDVLDDLEEEKL